MLRRPAVISTCAATGVLLEIGVFMVSGRREAWDSPVFWTAGLPIAALIAFAVGFLAAGSDWLWTAIIAPSQVLTMMARSGQMGNLWPLTLVLSSILSAPFIGVAFVGSRFRPAKYRAAQKDLE
jgi:hypothetical protein